MNGDTVGHTGAGDATMLYGFITKIMDVISVSALVTELKERKQNERANQNR